MTVQSQLKKMQKAWGTAEAKSGFVPLDDGTYQVRIDEATIKESKTSKRLQVEWALAVLTGDAQGRTVKKFDGIDDEESISWFKGGLERLEVECPDEILELGEVLESLQGTGAEITVKTRDEYQNIYFNEVIDIEDLEEEGDGEDEEGEDESGEEAPDLDEMGKDELLEFIDEKKLEVKNAKKLTAVRLRKAVKEALEEAEAEPEDEEEGEDLSEMDKDELIAYMKKKKIKIPGYAKLTTRRLRKAIEAELE